MFSRHITEFANVTSSLPAKGAMMTLSSTVLLETQDGWRKAAQLSPGTQIATLDGGFVTLAWTSRIKPSKDLYYVPAGVLNNCAPMLLPNGTLVGQEAPVDFDASSDIISLPIDAFDGSHGIYKTKRASVQTLTLGFDTEEMVWAQTGTLLHARPMSDAFFQSLRFDEARTLIACAKRQDTPDAVAA